MKKIIFILLLALSLASCTKEEDVNPNENCWRVTRVESFVYVNHNNGQITSRVYTIYLYKPPTDLVPQRTKSVKKYNSNSYRAGDWYCE